jgi:hypothetical protein
MVDVEKVKDRDTGGQQTELNNSVMFDFNRGLGFKCSGFDPIKRPNFNPEQAQLNGFNDSDFTQTDNLPF